MEWLYEKTADNSARYILGTVGANPLVCVGINPSTAEPNKLDPTVNCVRRLALSNGYDSFVMFNLYPQRATNPNHLHRVPSPELVAENERHIAAYIGGRDYTLWAAWGSLIDKRPFLVPLLQSIASLPELQKCTWVSRGKVTQQGHPHHPLYVKKEKQFTAFDMAQYLPRL